MGLWQARGFSLAPAFGILGILNVTPDSFYDGGRFLAPERALTRAFQLRQEGCDVLDIGAESSRPGASQISAAQELERLLPVLRAVCREMPDLPVSVDTWKGSVAAAALEMGASIVNDISGCQWDPSLAEVLRQYQPGYVLMHSPGPDAAAAPEYADVVQEVRKFFDSRLNLLVRLGIAEESIILDPGVGFGKTFTHNLELLIHMEEFLQFGRPLMVGISMKSFFGALLGLPTTQRGPATAVASAVLWQKGVLWHRAHDVAAVREALVIASTLAASSRGAHEESG